MTTEAELIYTIWDIVRSGQVNNDDNLNERLMRQFLSIHRGKHISKMSLNGQELPDEVFQFLGPLPFTSKGDEMISEELPKIIRLKDNSGIQCNIDGRQISIVGAEDYLLAKRDRFNKIQPLAKYINNHLVIYKGESIANQLDDFAGSPHNALVLNLKSVLENGTYPVNVQAVLVNPDNEPGYDFTSSPYPFPDDLIEDLINSVNAREFGIYLRTRGDKIGNSDDETTQEAS